MSYVSGSPPLARDPSPQPLPSCDAPIVDLEMVMDDAQERSLLGIVELVLKNPRRLNRMIRDTSLNSELIPRFLALEIVAFAVFGATLALVMSAAGFWPKLTAVQHFLDSPTGSLIEFETIRLGDVWRDGSALRMMAAYNIGLIAAVGICLPSLYFYGLLAGVRMTMLDVTAHAIKSQVAMAVALIGILPIYVAISLGVKVFQFPDVLTQCVLQVGMILPFIAGLWGTWSLYIGFVSLADTLPADRRCRRECLLRRLLVSWTACWTAVTPVMIYTLWEFMARS